eukprot:4696694-Pyramimonas_sp.AAC.1
MQFSGAVHLQYNCPRSIAAGPRIWVTPTQGGGVSTPIREIRAGVRQRMLVLLLFPLLPGNR